MLVHVRSAVKAAFDADATDAADSDGKAAVIAVAEGTPEPDALAAKDDKLKASARAACIAASLH